MSVVFKIKKPFSFALCQYRNEKFIFNLFNLSKKKKKKKKKKDSHFLCINLQGIIHIVPTQKFPKNYYFLPLVLRLVETYWQMQTFASEC